MSAHRHEILIGCSGWSYPDWEGPFYPAGMPAADYLEYYAGHFPIVEVDSTFYRPPSAGMVRGWRTRTPEGFKFALKVPKVITHEKLLQNVGEEVDGFVSSILGLGPKLAVALLQMGYFNRSMFESLDAFLPVLDDFLGKWPMQAVPLAVEVRNPRWVGPELLGVLKSHDASFVLTDQKWMPTPATVANTLDPITGPFGFVRLLGDREAIERLTCTWGAEVVDRSADIAETADVLAGLATRAPTLVFLNNHYAGHSPATARRLREALGIDEPTPPPRRRTTLFD